MSNWFSSLLRRNVSQSRHSQTPCQGFRQLVAECLEDRMMLSVDPVLTLTIHGFSGTNEGAGLGSWQGDYASIISALVDAYDSAEGSSITSSTTVSIGTSDFTLPSIGANQNLNVEVDWKSGLLTTSLFGTTVTTLNLTSSKNVASAIAVSIWNFLETQETLYNQTWDIVLIGYSRGGFVAQYITEALQALSDADSTHAQPDYVEEILLDPTGVITGDVGVLNFNTTYVVPEIVDQAINYSDNMNLVPLVTRDSLTLERADGSTTGISNINIKSEMKAYLKAEGLLHWYTVSYVLSVQSHVNIPYWYDSSDTLSDDILEFLANKDQTETTVSALLASSSTAGSSSTSAALACVTTSLTSTGVSVSASIAASSTTSTYSTALEQHGLISKATAGVAARAETDAALLTLAQQRDADKYGLLYDVASRQRKSALAQSMVDAALQDSAGWHLPV